MKTLIDRSPVALAVAAAGAQTTTQSQIRHVETSLNHLTVLEFGESVTTLAIGDPDSFQVERHDDKVFVKPLQRGVSTNLFVWTATRELNYELDPAGQLAAMDVLVRAEPAPKPHTSALASAEPSDAEIRKIASLVLTQAMMGSEDIAHDSVKPAPNRVEVESGAGLSREGPDIHSLFGRQPDRRSVPGDDAGCVPPLPTEQSVSLVSLRDHQSASQTFAAFKAKPGSNLAVMQAGVSPSRSFTWGEDNRRHQH